MTSYRPVGPGDSPFVFESPVRRSPFAYVAELSDVRGTLQPGTGSYSLRATIPWTALAIQPAGGTKLRGDIGLLFGDDTGANTLQRVHWVDRETNVVNDTPTEAEFFPERWGTWTLQDESGKTTRVAPTERNVRRYAVPGSVGAISRSVRFKRPG